MRIYTNRDQVETFHLDISKQITQGCDQGQQCIIIANLDTRGYICLDSKCEQFLEQNMTQQKNYVVGQNFFARIQFADNTYKKYLQVTNVKFIDDRGIYNYAINTQFWILRQNFGSVDINVLLFQPQVNASIVVELKISLDLQKMNIRNLKDQDQNVQQVFTQINVLENQKLNESKNVLLELKNFGIFLIFKVLIFGVLIVL
ncbi:hypothetical protein IMG5_110220 [Ichthyophthirius multifiliis]|uniref:Transmembrane protein n=1 Tax=Ichthyophthirius multifiliis TaxID=5932 RepID=G0QTN3_ICHMU|nr:hypothetical protein IMG5_110220 [Ichthyophthirius multifiliis]EGR31406.1 hypothetical protein IMG5_110220 [Ichthyophthirius multifiliis]|eukprot:XP_004034892.1 hypothetical protein IMG5_110220 [Ichthyophthirius multifiliis]